MRFGIIGSGYIGSTLTRKLTKLGHTVYLSNSRGPDSLKDIATETGAIPVETKEAIANGEIIIVSIPQKNILNLSTDLFCNIGENVIIVDTGNYYPNLRDGVIEGLDGKYTDSEWVQKHLGNPVIKVFNSILYTSLAKGSKPKGDSKRIGLPVAGDNLKSKETIMELVESLGFDPVDGGLLKESWRQQPGSIIYCTDLQAIEIKEHLNKMGKERTQESINMQIVLRSKQEEDVIKMSSNYHSESANNKTKSE